MKNYLNYLIALGMICVSINLDALIGDLVSDVVGTADNVAEDVITTTGNVTDTIIYPYGDRVYYDSDSDYILGLESENDRLRSENARLQKDRANLQNNYSVRGSARLNRAGKYV